MVVAFREAVEFVEVLVRVAVEDHAGDFFREAFDMRVVFRAAECLRIGFELKEFDVDAGAGFQNAAGVSYLFGAGLGRLHAFIDGAEGRGRNRGALRGLVTGRQIALFPLDVVHDGIGLF